MHTGKGIQRYSAQTVAKSTAGEVTPVSPVVTVGDVAFDQEVRDWSFGLSPEALKGLRKRGIENDTVLFGSLHGGNPAWVVTWSGGLRKRPNGVYVITVGHDGRTRLRCLASGKPHSHEKVKWPSLVYQRGTQGHGARPDRQPTPEVNLWMTETAPTRLVSLVGFPSSMRDHYAKRGLHDGIWSETIAGYAVGEDVVVFRITRSIGERPHQSPDQLLAHAQWTGDVWRLTPANVEKSTRSQGQLPRSS